MTDMQIKIIKDNLIIQLKKYISTFKKEYSKFIPKNILDFLNNIDNYDDLITIEETNTITCFVRNRKIYLPLLADRILNNFKKHPKYKSDPNHKTYQSNTLIINDNTFLDYINHAILAGISLQEFYEDMLLHEAMHLCGMAGATAFQEGINELKTRELAKKYNFKTNACGYYKEVKIIYRLQEIFGNDIITKISFQMSNQERRTIIKKELGNKALELFDKIFILMEEEFNNKYYKYTFSGPNAHIEKAKKYSDIDYTEIYKIIDEYCNNN